MPLSTWLALFDLLLPLLPQIMERPPTSTSKVYPKIIGVEAAANMEEAAAKMAAAIKGDGLNGHESVGVDDSIADLMELLSGIWLMQIGATGFKEEPLPAWLKSYLIDPKENESYDAWSWADKVWSIYSFFSFKETKDIEVAFEELVKKAGLTGDEQLAASDFLDGILESESKRLGLPVKMTRKGLGSRSICWLAAGWTSNKVSPSPSVKPGVVDEDMGMVDRLKAELKETKLELLQ
jgi:hypothetical protein